MKINKLNINEINDGLIDIKNINVISYDDFNPVKYNGKLLVDNIMLFLRNFNKKIIKINLDDFLKQTNIDKNIFLTFLKEYEKTKIIKFKIILKDNILIFNLKDKDNNKNSNIFI